MQTGLSRDPGKTPGVQWGGNALRLPILSLETHSSMKRSHVLQLLTLGLLCVGYIALYRLAPPRYTIERHWGEAGVNWFGQGNAVAWVATVVIFIVLYTVRYLILQQTSSHADAAIWYTLLLVFILPWVWLFVVVDWDNEWVLSSANWVGIPMTLLFVPTAFFVYDLLASVRLSPGPYTARVFLEVFVAGPVWVVCWFLCQVFILGWVSLG